MTGAALAEVLPAGAAALPAGDFPSAAGAAVSVAAEKSAVRREVLARRAAMGAAARAAASAVICEKIVARPEYRRAQCIAAFAPLAEEVNIWPVLADAVRKGKTVALPRVAGPGKIVFHQVSGEGNDGAAAGAAENLQKNLICGYKNILEPRADSPAISPSCFTLAIVPAVAVAKNNLRLGYGGGFYDILLSELAKKTKKTKKTAAATLAAPVFCPVFRCQFVSVLPAEPHDWRVDFFFTEE